jgi:hypothetical protein
MPDVKHRLSAALADRYSILRDLGAGGIATVSLAEDRKHRRQVAVKVLGPALPSAKRFRPRRRADRALDCGAGRRQCRGDPRGCSDP